jgi:hypothetical protein
MKKFLKLFKGNGGQVSLDTHLDAIHIAGCPQFLTCTPPPQAAAPADGNAAPRLNEALSSKARHPSAIPGSFYERDRKFKAQSTTKRGLKAVAVPRTEGPIQ